MATTQKENPEGRGPRRQAQATTSTQTSDWGGDKIPFVIFALNDMAILHPAQPCPYFDGIRTWCVFPRDRGGKWKAHAISYFKKYAPGFQLESMIPLQIMLRFNRIIGIADLENPTDCTLKTISAEEARKRSIEAPSRGIWCAVTLGNHEELSCQPVRGTGG